jgi:glycosyltransferase involved in cell wall biosynthesis
MEEFQLNLLKTYRLNKKVSIIIPSYNALPFIKDTLQKVFDQSYDNYEVIVIDDGSADGTLEFLHTLDYPKLLVKSNKGKGACAARNYGFEISTGEYIQYLDADDFFSSEKIGEQVQLLEQNKDKIAVCSTVHFNMNPKEGIITDKDFLYSTDDSVGFLLNLYGSSGKHSMVQTSAWLTPRALINKAGLWDVSLHKDQDGEFFCRVVMQSKGVVYASNGLNYYRKHKGGNNIANKKEQKHIESQLKALNFKKDQLSDVSETNEFKSAFALQYKILAINAYPDFKQVYKKSMQTSNALGGSNYVPVLGGKVIETIKFILGWKSAKLFRLFLHRVRGRLIK